MWLRSKAKEGKGCPRPDGPQPPAESGYLQSRLSTEASPAGQGRRTLFRFRLSLLPPALHHPPIHSSLNLSLRPGWTYQVFVWITAALAGLRAGRRKFRNGVDGQGRGLADYPSPHPSIHSRAIRVTRPPSVGSWGRQGPESVLPHVQRMGKVTFLKPLKNKLP